MATPTGTCPAAKGRCGACVQLGWTCSPFCVFAKCFPADRPNKFAIIQRAFGTGPVWRWLALIPPDQRMKASEYLAQEASYRLRWWAKNRPGYKHPPGQGTLIYSPMHRHGWHLGAAADAVRVAVPLQYYQHYHGETSGANENGY